LGVGVEDFEGKNPYDEVGVVLNALVVFEENPET
jgi:hypothetical protein